MFYSYHIDKYKYCFFFQRYSFYNLIFLVPYNFFFLCVWNTKYISYALVIFHKLGQQLLSMKSFFVMYVSKILSPLQTDW